jgi:hypothetical protein
MSKEFLAKYGTPAHQDKLVNDRDPYVRAGVAERGNDSHRDKLVNDSDPDVSNYAKHYMKSNEN